MHIPRPLRELAQKCQGAQGALQAELGRAPTVPEIATKLGISPADVAFAMDSAMPVRSLYEPAYTTPDAPPLIDAIPGEPSPAEVVCDSVALKNALSQLSAPARSVIIMRFFEERTQVQVAKALGVSQPQAHRIEKAALVELRRNMAGE